MNSDIQFQIECLTAELAEMLMEEYGWDIPKALDELYNSLFYEKLNDTKCELYYQGAVYLFNYFKSEVETGTLNWLACARVAFLP